MRPRFVLIFLIAVALAGPAAAQSEPQDLVNRAQATVQRMRTDRSFGNSTELLRRARAVMIVPGLIKGGFFVGAEGGQGVLVARGPAGWSDPAFYTMGSASFGLQIGLEAAEVVLFVMSERALRAWMTDSFTLGPKAGLAIITIGANAQVGATTNLNADVIAWAKAQGLYGGITLEGAVIKPRDSYNEAYYGGLVAPGDIIAGRIRHNPGADGLRAALR